ncbi:PREDICTED: uncharacterized protein LOC109236571 [Nicotiana attenuata]|uniref:uncharacterized protein LOC109236571 n=1 Tax=Nicotiana attenuata TaxID=49451 RepID=UPI000905163B|nr:PREDICTED: uncharacterized protein LOC109236571 [Nicotiana attenuata]
MSVDKALIGEYCCMMPLEGKPTDVLSTLPENIIDDILVRPITKCTLDISISRGCSKIDDLISFLSRNGVQHLVLRLSWRIEPYYKLPSSFFTCSQLRHLTLENCLIELLPPAFKGFDRLIRLELCYVAISTELLGSLISRCLLLENLVLENIRVSTNNIIEINAPRLRSFDYEGNTRPLFFKDIPRLAKLSFSYCQYFARAGKINIAKFFEPFSALEHLHLDIASIQLNVLHHFI